MYEFISENYIWIIVVAVIVVMTIIGYIADKTNFGEKKENKKRKSKKNQLKMEPENEEDFSDMESFDKPVELPKESNEETFEQENLTQVPVEDFSDSEYDIPNDEMSMESQPVVEEPTELSEENSQEDLTQVPVEENLDSELTEEIGNEEIVEPVMPLDDFEMPIDNPVEDQSTDEHEQYEGESEIPVVSEETVEPIEPENFELPNIEQLNKEIADVEEDEDVWKF